MLSAMPFCNALLNAFVGANIYPPVPPGHPPFQGDNKPPLKREVARSAGGINLIEDIIPLSAYADIPLFKGDNKKRDNPVTHQRANHVHPYETNKKAPPGNQISRQCRNISAVIFPQTRCFSAAALPHRSPPAKRTRRRCLRPDRCRPPAHAAAPCHRSPASAAW